MKANRVKSPVNSWVCAVINSVSSFNQTEKESGSGLRSRDITPKIGQSQSASSLRGRGRGPLKNIHTHTHTKHNGKKKKRNEKKTIYKSKSDTSSFLKEGGGEGARRTGGELQPRSWEAVTVLTGPGAVGAWREDLPGQVERHAPRAAAAYPRC